MQTAQNLAERFCYLLREWLDPEHLDEVVRRNAMETDSRICHSHDFVDANLAMIDALDEPWDGNDPAQEHMIAEAWDLAKASGFSLRCDEWQAEDEVDEADYLERK